MSQSQQTVPQQQNPPKQQLTNPISNGEPQEKQKKEQQRKEEEKKPNPAQQIQNDKQKGKEEKKKEITLSAKQMANIQKQLGKLEQLKKENTELKAQAKTYKQENQQLRNYSVALQKKLEQAKKADNKNSKQAMEQTIKHLHKMVDESSKNEERAKKQEIKYRQLVKQEREMNSSLKTQVEQLRSLSKEYFLLKQQVSRLTNQTKTLREQRQQYPIMLKKYEQLELINEKFQRNLEEVKKQYQAERELRDKMQHKLQTVIQSNKDINNEKIKILCEKQEICGELEALKKELEYERTERELRQKKVAMEIKQLKVALHQEHQKLKITQHQLQEARKNAKQTVDLDKVKLSSLEKQDLFNLLEQSEMKIVSLKIAINDASQKVSQMSEKLKQKDNSIMTLARQLTKEYPNLDESEGMDYIEKDIIEMGKLKKDDWGQIVQKVMIQNLRLKSSVTALGEQYNSMMRLEKERK